MTNILSIKNLTKKYHTPKSETLAIKDISLDIKKGEIIGIVGSSGCGKSTLLNILAGLDKQTSGEIIKSNLKDAYMLQSDALLPWLNVLDNACLGLKLKNIKNEENINFVKKLINNFGLESFMYSYPNNLSGGMKQRVALIRTLALKPDVLLLDEPLSALDSQSRLSIGNDIFHIIKEEGKTAIMVTHDISEALNISDRIILLSKRPGTVKKIYNINFNNNDFYSRKLDDNYNKLLDEIWRDLDVN